MQAAVDATPEAKVNATVKVVLCALAIVSVMSMLLGTCAKYMSSDTALAEVLSWVCFILGFAMCVLVAISTPLAVVALIYCRWVKGLSVKYLLLLLVLSLMALTAMVIEEAVCIRQRTAYEHDWVDGAAREAVSPVKGSERGGGR